MAQLKGQYLKTGLEGWACRLRFLLSLLLCATSVGLTRTNKDKGKHKSATCLPLALPLWMHNDRPVLGDCILCVTRQGGMGQAFFFPFLNALNWHNSTNWTLERSSYVVIYAIDSWICLLLTPPKAACDWNTYGTITHRHTLVYRANTALNASAIWLVWTGQMNKGAGSAQQARAHHRENWHYQLFFFLRSNYNRMTFFSSQWLTLYKCREKKKKKKKKRPS